MEDILAASDKLDSPGNSDSSRIEQEPEVRSSACSGGLCTQMCLSEYVDCFIIEPTDGRTRKHLFVDRNNGSLQLLDEMPQRIGEQPLTKSNIFGLLGVIHLLGGSYILVITGRELAGVHNEKTAYVITSMKFLHCKSSLGALTPQETKDEAHFVTLLRTVEKTSGLFFSYETDMSLSLQRADDFYKARKSQSLWKQADPRFVWNHFILEDLIEHKLDPYILPVIQGSFQEMKVSIKENHMNIVLIARRCNRRLGTRMWRRGADLQGHAANFVETEQIMRGDNHVASYVQVRGSIPLLWEQIVDLSYKPEPQLIYTEKTAQVVQRHFHDLVQQYGSILVVDLVNQEGSEKKLGLAYCNAMQNVVDQNVSYVPFDFHKVCGHVHFERLTILYDQIQQQCNEQGVFLADVSRVIEKQEGIVRVNCVDCLDRTNVTQTLLGRKVLKRTLQKMDIFDEGESISDHKYFDHQFKALWAAHGDDISIQYSGTQALKGDFVRNGKRTFMGFLQDGFNALARYYLNNFQDGSKQDALDLISGQYVVSRHKPSPFQLNGFEAFAYFPLASAMIVAGLLLTTNSIWQVGQDAYHYVASALWASVTACIAALVRTNGRQFCSRPRLCKLL